jgi:hypothetical protein
MGSRGGQRHSESQSEPILVLLKNMKTAKLQIYHCLSIIGLGLTANLLSSFTCDASNVAQMLRDASSVA